jgi:predicted nucleotidyltransferase
MNSLDASTDPRLESTGTVLAKVLDRAARCDVRVMVVGAKARDILVTSVTGSPPARATQDIDIAVAVSSWSDVQRLTDGLERFSGVAHRYRVDGCPIDIIPFGAIESLDRRITWPDDHEMSVLGFQEALSAAVTVELPHGVSVAVASLPSQSLLKLFAWRDRGSQSRRDAIDLRYILLAYSEGRYLDALYTEHEDLLERNDFDPQLAGAERLGVEAATTIGTTGRAAARTVLHPAEKLARLAAAMGTAVTGNIALLSSYARGLTTSA